MARRTIISLACLGIVAAMPARAQEPPEHERPGAAAAPGWHAALPGSPAPRATTAGDRPARPPLGARRILGELGAGLATGAVAGVLAGLGTARIACAIEDAERCGMTEAVALLAGSAGGYTLGAALGVAAVGTIGDQTGALWASLLGSAVGMGTGILLIQVGQDWPVSPLLLALTLPPLGATAFFNITRAYEPGRAPARRLGLLRVEGRDLGWSLPAVAVTPDPLRPGTTIKSIRLVDGRF